MIARLLPAKRCAIWPLVVLLFVAATPLLAQDDGGPSPPFGVLEYVSAGTMYQNQTFTGYGWAVDPQSGGPADEVDVVIDGHPVCFATTDQPTDGPYGGNTGFTFSYNIGSLSPGQHTITSYAYEYGTGLFGYLSGVQVFTVLAAPPPTGVLEYVGAGTIYQNQSFTSWGWAADPASGGNVSEVDLLIDGNAVCQATLGQSTNGPYANTGFVVNYNIGGLSPGQHTVTAQAVDANGTTLLPGIQVITVVAAPPPTGVLEYVGASTIYQNQSFTSWGWAADPASGGNVSEVDLLIDGNPVCLATLGQSTDGPYANTGFIVNYNIGGLSPGQHTVTAQAVDAYGTTLLSGVQVITVSARPPPAGTMEFVSAGTPFYQNETFTGYGWAADPVSGGQVSEVDVVIDGNVVCQATLGQSTDGPYGGSTGFTFSYNIGMLGLGQHYVWTQAIDQYGVTRLNGTQLFTVRAVNQPATILGLNVGFCTFEQSNIEQDSSLYEPPLFYPYDSEVQNAPQFTPFMQWWVNLVEEAAFAHVQYLAMGCDGDSDAQINFRSATKLWAAVAALDSRGYQGVVNLALFDDTNGYGVSYAQDHPPPPGQPPPPIDMSDPTNWAKYWWQYKWEPFFKNVPDQYRQKIQGRPLVIIWAILPKVMTNVNGSLSPLIDFLRSKCLSEFKFDPFIVVDASWLNYDSNILQHVDGVHSWFDGKNQWTKYTANARSGTFTTGVCVPGYYSPGYIYLPRNYGNSFANALSHVISSNLVLIENQTDTGENTEVYRGAPDCPSPFGTPPAGERWICPNHYLDIIRDYNIGWAGAMTFEAEACDAFYSPSSPPAGNMFRRAGNLSISYTDASQTNWAVNLQTSE
ncbi:MAG TPA: DUF5010 domain-containing protein, partial [Opitutaceae bacterium]|nr:DUF5010 domain-containing protein [Opitutaceae bacterium]